MAAAPVQAQFIDGLRAELRAGVDALRVQVAERQRGLEESLRQWVASELAKLKEDTEKVQDQLDRDKWQNESFSEHINRRLLSLETSFSQQLQQQPQQEHGQEGPATRHPLAEMGRVLTSLSSCGGGDSTSGSRGPNTPLVMSPRSLQESSRFIESRLTTLEVSVKGIDNLGTTLLLEGLDSSLEGLRARVLRLEQRWEKSASPRRALWEKSASPRRAAPDTDQSPKHRRQDGTCSTRAGGSHGSAPRGGSHGSQVASVRSTISNNGPEDARPRSIELTTAPPERACAPQRRQRPRVKDTSTRSIHESAVTSERLCPVEPLSGSQSSSPEPRGQALPN